MNPSEANTRKERIDPQWRDMAAVITHKSEYRGQAIKKFKKEDMPRIAISVNMLETGVDVPEVDCSRMSTERWLNCS